MAEDHASNHMRIHPNMEIHGSFNISTARVQVYNGIMAKAFDTPDS
jgi:hypothetical protein